MLVGVAAVGKTTLGRRAASLCQLPFADTDETMERSCAVALADLSREPGGDARIDALLWATYRTLLAREERTVIAATPRLLGRDDVWRLTRARAHSIHLRATPLVVLARSLAMGEAAGDGHVQPSKAEKAAFYDYYVWRLRHCQRADVALRLTGSLDVDAERLASLVAVTGPA